MSTPQTQRPQPDPIRFYGTSWVDHTRGYGARRFALGLGASLLAALGILGLKLGYNGLTLSQSASWLRVLVIVAFAGCTAMAFTRAMRGWTRPQPSAGADEAAFRSIKIIGFVGILLAYALRSAVEAPGERMRRMDHEAAVEQYERLTSKRSRNPSRKAGRAGDGGTPARRRGEGARRR
ncbi:hypothetical protein ACWGNE_11785 [Streptomyces xiamenensis]